MHRVGGDAAELFLHCSKKEKISMLCELSVISSYKDISQRLWICEQTNEQQTRSLTLFLFKLCFTFLDIYEQLSL